MLPDLTDYRDRIAEVTQGFTGREWVFQAIDAWLADPSGSRSFILSGDPGCGKTAIAARVVQIGHGWDPGQGVQALGPASLASYHFCQAQSDRTLNPLRFIESLSKNLANHLPAFGQALTQVRHGEITIIQATQTIGSAASGAVATNVAIGSLHIGDLSPRLAFDQIVRQPLESLGGSGPGGPILVLVDALDEALTFDPTNNLVELLRHIGDFPRQVRWLFTTRRDSRVFDLLGEPALDLVLDEPGEKNDVQTFVHGLMGGSADDQRFELARMIATAAKGNFLYARYVANDLIRRTPDVSALNALTLPKDLAGHYREFLERELASSKKDYYRRYRPVLGLIAVSRGPGLTTSQIAGVTGISTSETQEILLSCEQYLSGAQTSGPVRIYHQSFRDFLLQDSKYKINGAEANTAVAAFFLGVHRQDWLNCGVEYAWRYTAVHLALAIEQLKDPSEAPSRRRLSEDLAALLTDPQFLVTNFCQRPELFPSRLEELLAGQEWARQSDGTLRGQRHAFEYLGQWLSQSSAKVSLLTGGAGTDCSGIISRWVEHVTEQSRHGDGSLYRRLTVLAHFCTPAEAPALAFADLAHQLAGRYPRYAQGLAESISFDAVPERSSAEIEQWVGWAVVDALRRLPADEAFLVALQTPMQTVLAGQPGERIVLALDSLDVGFPLEPLLASDFLQLPLRLLLTCDAGSHIRDFVLALVPDAFSLTPHASPREPLETPLGRELETRGEPLASFDNHALTWLALPPVWTLRLAAASAFPTGGQSLEAFVTRAEAAGLCQRADARAPSGQADAQFWMSSETRQVVIAELHARGQGTLQESVSLIARRILQVRLPKQEDVPVRVMRWAMLSDRLTEAAAGWLDQTIQHLVDAGDTATALSWLEAASLLGRTLGGGIDRAARVAARRIMLALRIQSDARQLRSYLMRREQIADVDSLLNGPEQAWALHVLGPGGMGKTSLLRYIAAGRHAGRLASSRVDFDYLNSSHPSRMAGTLLMEFATDLRVFGTSERQERLFGRLQARIHELHAAADLSPESHRAAPGIETPRFRDTLDVFCDFVESLPPPVVLMLDTCEELQAIQKSRQPSRALEAVFAILEQVHDRVPSTRVILAGSRPLARSGYKWTHDQVTDLPARPYLRLHVIQGFDEGEARDFAQMRGTRLSEEMILAILAASTAPLDPTPVTFESGSRMTPGIRYRPFELSLYLQWALDDPMLRPETISMLGVDAYVSTRIVSRIAPNLRAYLPAVVLLRRFDREMLQSAGVTISGDFDQVLDELAAQEWMDTQHDFATGVFYLDVNPTILPRLEAYYRRGASEQLERIRQRLEPALLKMVYETPLIGLSVAQISAALRLAPEDRAAALWADLDRRIVNERMWQWAEVVATHLLGEDTLSLAETSPVREAVAATYQSARSHTSS